MTIQSKTKKVEKYLRHQIAQGIWAPGDRLPHHNDIGLQMGVSEPTVKSAMVRLAGEGILDRKQRLGTYVSNVTTISNIGILCPSEALSSKVGFYYQALLKAAKAAIYGSGHRMVLTIGHGKGDEFISSINLLDSAVAKNTIGAFVIACPPDIHESLERAGIHAVSIGPDGTKPRVNNDYGKLLEIAAKQFYDYGYDDYVLMEMSPHSSDKGNFCYRERERINHEYPGFGPQRCVSLPWCGVDYDTVYEEFKRFWRSERRPKAIFFSDDGVCDIAARAIMELGIKVPEELGIITESCVGRKFDFPLEFNRIECNPNELVAAAYSMMNMLINGQELEQEIVHIAPRIRPGLTL